MAEREATVKLSMEGVGAVLLDVAGGVFDEDRQRRIWALATRLRTLPEVTEAVPGMNNLMVTFDPLTVDPAAIERRILQEWAVAPPEASAGKVVEVSVVYGGLEGPDLVDVAETLGLTSKELIDRHAAPVYSVAAVGAMPGFVYLSGLDPTLALPRRAVPRRDVPVGAVIIGGAQAGIMPITAPSGWHILGRTSHPLFDPHRDPPAAFRPGDRIRFVARGQGS